VRLGVTASVLTAALAIALALGWRGLASTVSAGAPGAPPPAPGVQDVLPESARDSHVFECFLGDGVTLARSPGLDRDALPRFADARGVPVFRDIVLPDGRPARAVAVKYSAPTPPSPAPLLASFGGNAQGGPGDLASERALEVVVAQPTQELDAILGQLRWLLVASWVATSLLSAAGLTWVVRRGLNPLEDLGDQIHGKDESDLRTPFSLEESSEELSPVVERLNGFMGRVGAAIEREHAFAAHAAHELRTPLAGLRSTLEVSLSREREPEEYRESERASLEIAEQLERLVSRLLELSRSAGDTSTIARDRVHLLTFARECWTPYSDAAAERGVLLEMRIPPAMQMTTDRQLLGRVLHNLLENLSNYADEGSVSWLRVTPAGDVVTFEVENAREGVDPGVAEHAFDPFWRSERARSAVGRHAGLGLAIVREIAERLGGSVRAVGEDGVFRVVLTLPLVGSEPGRLDEHES